MKPHGGRWAEASGVALQLVAFCLTARTLTLQYGVRCPPSHDAAKAVALIEDGRSFCYVADRLRESLGSVHRAVKRFHVHQTYSRIPDVIYLINQIDDRISSNLCSSVVSKSSAVIPGNDLTTRSVAR
ncbi:hypothetical protein C0J52_27818 [Blattella germanica]|nr:hypothetical protein C0J52_27818 [Blattella germanica]